MPFRYLVTSLVVVTVQSGGLGVLSTVGGGVVGAIELVGSCVGELDSTGLFTGGADGVGIGGLRGVKVTAVVVVVSLALTDAPAAGATVGVATVSPAGTPSSGTTLTGAPLWGSPIGPRKFGPAPDRYWPMPMPTVRPIATATAAPGEISGGRKRGMCTGHSW